jgi:hypothetical protein
MRTLANNVSTVCDRDRLRLVRFQQCPQRRSFSLRCEKSAFFAYFASMRNVEILSETKKKRKTAIIFASKRNEAKRKRKTAIIFASKRNEAKQKRKNAIIFASKRNGSKIFLFDAKKCYFRVFSHLR